jgi:hypothetical protein
MLFAASVPGSVIFYSICSTGKISFNTHASMEIEDVSFGEEGGYIVRLSCLTTCWESDAKKHLHFCHNELILQLFKKALVILIPVL